MFIEEWLLQKLLREEEEANNFYAPKFFDISTVYSEVETQGMEALKMPLTSISDEGTLNEVEAELHMRLERWFGHIRPSRNQRGGCF